MLHRRLVVALLALLGLAAARPAAAHTVLVEAESFKDSGGWSLDTQFIHIMGSPYLLAHGLGEPVKDATTTVTFPKTGKYRVFVRTKDWVARWNAPGAPGKFQVIVDGKPLATTFGTEGAEWHWQAGGEVEVTKLETTVALHDLTGFEGRCDAIVFTNHDGFVPTESAKELAKWRKQTLGLPEKPKDEGPFDLVVVGGGYGGLGSAIAAARMGCKVALIQDRPVLGGNGSSEIRVWSMGSTTLGKYPRLGEITEEFADRAKASPGTKEEFGDDRKELIVGAEDKISLFLNQYMHAVEMDGKNVKSVTALDTRTGAETRFAGRLFVDATGHGFLGKLAGADYDMKEKGHMGMSNMWRWTDAPAPTAFPETPWALPLAMKDFPYPTKGKAEWFWEGGFFRHPIDDLEYIRDWNFRANYGAFNAMKNGDGKAKHANAKLEWMAYVGGNRESRRLLGDVVLTKEDIVGKKDYPDGCVPTTWDIDLHVPREQYAQKFPEDPFISRAIFGKGVDRSTGYPIPYRCLYSRNVPNLFMAGRLISVDPEALGTIRVMRTIGMMGEVVGKAASICVKNNCAPRDVYGQYLDELKELLNQPGNARRAKPIDQVDAAAKLPYDPNQTGGRAKPHRRAPESRPATNAATGTLDPKKLPGIVVDDEQATRTGDWTAGAGLSGFAGIGYHYTQGGKGATARFEFTVPAAGNYEVRALHSPHENRATAVTHVVTSADGDKPVVVNQQKPGTAENGFVSLGTFRFDPAKPGAVTVTAAGAKGNVAIDAVQVLPAK
ncbi:MAG TPA: FAD-dependent oxidoreductase [Humisphaera sp.]